MSVRLNFAGETIAREMADRIEQALIRAAVELQMEARQLCSRPAKRITRRKRDGGTYTEYVPSNPGNPPALRTGVGRSSITWWSAGPFVKRVGVRANGTYMIMHELGAGHLPKRPWLKTALQRKRSAIAEILRRAVQR